MKNKGFAVYGVALLYMGSLMYGWLGPDGLVTTADYFTQAALVMTALGLYNTEPPGSTSRVQNEGGYSLVEVGLFLLCLFIALAILFRYVL